jgi:hypothetical protein
MPVRVNCSACDKKLQIRDDAVGKKIKCPGCGAVFLAKGVASAAIKAAPTKAAPTKEAPTKAAPTGPARTSSTATTRTPPPLKASPQPQAKRPAPPPPPLDDDDEDDEDDIDDRPRPTKRRVRHVKSSSGLVLWLVLGLVVVLGGAVGVYFLFFHNSGTTPIAKGNNLQPGNNAAPPGAALADLVPGDSFAFASISGDVWNAPALAQVRQGFGKEAEAGFEKEVGFPIGDLDRVSMFAVGNLTQAKQNPAPPMVVLVQTKKPVDQNKVTQAIKSSQFGKDPTLAIEFLSDTAFVAAQQPMLQRYKEQRGKVKATGVLERALTQAATSKGAIIAVTIPPEAAQDAKDVPPQFAVLLKAKELLASVDLTDKLLLNASLVMEDAAAAAEAKQTADGFIGMARLMLSQGGKDPQMAMMAQIGNQALNDLKLDVKDKEITLAFQTDAAMAVGLLVPALQKVRQAAGNVSAGNNLKMIGLAWHNYANANKTLPPQTWNKGLSWRVAILPYQEESNLYGQFKHDEPWDSPHNRKLIPLMPKIYAAPGANPVAGRTFYQTFVGPNTINPSPGKGMSFAQIRDGTTNTLIVIEGPRVVEWTRPDDIVVAPDQPIAIGGAGLPTVQALFADGMVRHLPRQFDQKMLRSLIDPADGMIVPLP